MTYRDIDSRIHTMARMALAILTAAAIAGMLAATAFAGDNARGTGSVDPAEKEIRNELAAGHFRAGLKAVNKGDTDEAISQFEQTVEADPKAYNTRLMLAKLYTTKHRGSDAERMLQGAIDVKPDDPRAYDLLISLYLFRDKPKMAVSVGEQALANGVDDKLLLDLGWAYYMSGMYKKAEERYERELEFRKDIYATYRNLGILYYATGMYDQSLYCYKKAEEESKDDKDLPFLMAITDVSMGAKEEASNQIRIFKERTPKGYVERAYMILDRIFPGVKLPDMKPYLYSYDPSKLQKNAK